MVESPRRNIADRGEPERTGDPRLSIAERYASKAAYLELVTKAAEALIAARYLLPTDLEAIVNQAAQRYDLYTGTTGTSH